MHEFLQRHAIDSKLALKSGRHLYYFCLQTLRLFAGGWPVTGECGKVRRGRKSTRRSGREFQAVRSGNEMAWTFSRRATLESDVFSLTKKEQ
jgi:hypothetical protein